MKGLICKDIYLFFKSTDKRSLLIIAALIVFVIYSAGPEAGLVVSIMLSLTIGIQNIMSFASDEKVRWNQYQMAMPVSSFSVVASKYISVACSLVFSFLCSMALNLVASIVYRDFNPSIWVMSGIFSVVSPLFWTGISLPLAYWFGFQSSRIMSLCLVIPMFYLVKSFEDGPGFSAMEGFFHSYILTACIVAVLFFTLSMMVSVAGYRRRK